MAESFLHLGERERSEIYRAFASTLARAPMVLEKDVWVCWALQTLFTMPGRVPMAFKGGTSLSKVFRAIERFSEDVDITLDYRGLDDSVDPFAVGISNSQLRKYSDALKGFVSAHARDVVAPHFRRRLADTLGAHVGRIEISDDGEQLRVHYPTALGASDDYVGNSVLIEFGGRNITEPNETHIVAPDIAAHLPELDFPGCGVTILSPTRTFWEKATLIHVACQRAEIRPSAARLSRHWYDLAMLMDLDIGRAALSDRELLADVVRHKKVFFNTSYANYDACLSGQLRLVPDNAALAALREDFTRMVDAGMFSAAPPDFATIVERLRALETAVNA